VPIQLEFHARATQKDTESSQQAGFFRKIRQYAALCYSLFAKVPLQLGSIIQSHLRSKTPRVQTYFPGCNRRRRDLPKAALGPTLETLLLRMHSCSCFLLLLLAHEQGSVFLRLVLRAQIAHLRHHVLKLVGLQVTVQLLVNERGVVDRHSVATFCRQTAQAAAVVKLGLVPKSQCMCLVSVAPTISQESKRYVIILQNKAKEFKKVVCQRFLKWKTAKLSIQERVLSQLLFLIQTQLTRCN